MKDFGFQGFGPQIRIPHEKLYKTYENTYTTTKQRISLVFSILYYVLLYAQTLIVVVLIVVNFFGFLVIAPYPTMRF